jgi:hypothetical protein
MKQNLFEVPFWHMNVSNFEKKKSQLIDWLKDYPEEKTGLQKFYTNKQIVKENDYCQKFISIMSHEINLFAKALKSDLEVTDVWSVSYKTGDYHTTHSHNSTGMSAILYLDLPSDSPVTTYIQPWSHIKSSKTIQLNVDVKQGDIVFVPSFILHFSVPNESMKTKRIISWDMKLLNA